MWTSSAVNCRQRIRQGLFVPAARSAFGPYCSSLGPASASLDPSARAVAGCSTTPAVSIPPGVTASLPRLNVRQAPGQRD